MLKQLLTSIKDLLGIATLPTLSTQELQALFKTKYRSFRELLTANNNALEAMAELETALRDGRTFSMSFIRSKSTVVTVNIYKMVMNLRRMADGRITVAGLALQRDEQGDQGGGDDALEHALGYVVAERLHLGSLVSAEKSGPGVPEAWWKMPVKPLRQDRRPD